jgi:hypothetical protein
LDSFGVTIKGVDNLVCHLGWRQFEETVTSLTPWLHGVWMYQARADVVCSSVHTTCPRQLPNQPSRLFFIAGTSWVEHYHLW